MPATPQVLRILFNGGLDTFSNSHVLPPGKLTASMGTMLDRPGSAYPGPGYSPTQWAPTPAGTRNNHGIAAYSNGPVTNGDQLLLWSTPYAGTGPGISVPGSSSVTPSVQPLAPWRQVTQRFQGDSMTTDPTLFPTGGTGRMVGQPQCAVVGTTAFYVWRVTTNHLFMAYQNLDTKAWAGPYVMDNTGNWVSGPVVAGYILTTSNQVAIGGDSLFLRVAMLGAGIRLMTYAASSPLTVVNNTTTAGNFVSIDIASTGDEVGTTIGEGVVAAYDGTNHKLVGFAFSGANANYSSSANIITGVGAGFETDTPFTVSPARTSGFSTGLIFALFDKATYTLKVVTTNLDLSGATATSITAGISGTPNVKQVTITNTAENAVNALAFVLEIKPAAATVPGGTATWNYLQFVTVATASPAAAITNTTRTGWGGLALLGKFYAWHNGAEFRALVPVRSGWYQLDGAFGTYASAGVPFAYPNGYLYDTLGQLYGKFGNADVGTDAMWYQFSSASYIAINLDCLASGFRYTLDSGQQTLTFPWPQYGFVGFVSSRSTDSGSPIGTRAGLSTVTWLAPTASEPPASAVQFGNVLIIPGTLTAYYDGASVFEAGFLHRSPTPLVASHGSGGTLPINTTYYYQIVMIYKDAAGRVHQAAPSRIVSVTTAAANDSIDIQIPTCGQTLRNGTSPIAFWIFRSTGNPGTSQGSTELYQLPNITISNADAGATTAAPFTTLISDSAVDSVLANCSPPYTWQSQTGAALGTYAPPPFDSLTVWNDQVWGVANRNGPELWCTWPLDNAELQPEGPAWSIANRVSLPAEIGQPKALVGLDEKLFILGTRSDYGIIGTAPARSVSFADDPSLFSAPYALPTPGGIRVLNGATRLPKGVLFQGTEGFVLLDRSMAYTPVGTAVTDFSAANLYLPGVFLPAQRAVVLFAANDATQNLVYFHETGEWAQSEQPPASDISTVVSSAIVGAARAVAGQGSQVYVLPATGVFYHQITAYSKYLTYRTPWIEMSNVAQNMASVAGSGYLREVQVLGQLPAGFPGTQTLTLTTEYDYEDNVLQPPEEQALLLSRANPDYQWRFGFSQGNARRVRFTVTVDGGERQSNGTTNAAVLLTGLMLSYDIDAGLSRLGAANSTGT
jgi:hypothetical protein